MGVAILGSENTVIKNDVYDKVSRAERQVESLYKVTLQCEHGKISIPKSICHCIYCITLEMFVSWLTEYLLSSFMSLGAYISNLVKHIWEILSLEK